MRNYIEINGVSSLTLVGFAINTLPPISKPPIRNLKEEIDGRDGDIITKLGYGAYDKEIEVGLYGESYDINDIIAFFNTEGEVVFSNEPDKIYNFTILDQIDFEKLVKFKTAVITLHCQPFKYPLTDTPIEVEYEYVTGEGENITLNDTDISGLELDLKGNTSQTGTPTPSSPIPVNVVSGSNKILVNGSNFITFKNFSEVTQNGVTTTPNNSELKLNGTVTQGNPIFNSQNLDLMLPKDTYTITYKIASGSVTRPTGDVAFYLRNGTTNISTVTIYQILSHNNTFSETFTIDSNASLYFYCYSNVGNIVFNNTVLQIQLSKGSTTTNFEQYIGNTYNIDLPVLGKNLFNKDTIINGKVLASNGALNDTSGFIVGDYIQVKPSTQYTISFDYTSKEYLRIGYYQKDKTFIERPFSGDKPWTITTPSNCYYIRICTPDNYTNVQCEEGNQQTTYEPFNGMELCKIGTYQDYIYKDNGNWYKKPMILKIASYNGETISTTYISTTGGLDMGATIYYVNPTSNPSGVQITDTTLISQLNALELATSKENQTNISQVNNDLPFIISASALKKGSDTASIVNDGNIYSKPLIDIEGTGLVTIYLDNTQMFQVNLSELNNITIDTELLEAYSDTQLANRKVVGDYSKFKLQVGTSQLKFGGALTKATITRYKRWL